jgi:hypothetical protein
MDELQTNSTEKYVFGGGGGGKGNRLWNVIRLTYDKTDPPNIALFTSAIVSPNFGFQKPRPQTGSRRASKKVPEDTTYR